MQASFASSGSGRGASARALVAAGPGPFSVDVERHDRVTIVRPRGELDLATVEPLRAVLDRIGHAARLVLDLRRLTFIDSAGLHLLVDIHRRAQRDAFQWALVAPAAPLDRAIELCGLYEVLPFQAADDALGAAAGDAQGGE